MKRYLNIIQFIIILIITLLCSGFDKASDLQKINITENKDNTIVRVQTLAYKNANYIQLDKVENTLDVSTCYDNQAKAIIINYNAADSSLHDQQDINQSKTAAYKYDTSKLKPVQKVRLLINGKKDSNITVLQYDKKIYIPLNTISRIRKDVSFTIDKDSTAEFTFDPNKWEGTSQTITGQELQEIVKGVAAISVKASPGSVEYYTDNWIPLIGGDNDTSCPNLFAAVSKCYNGKIIALGYEGLFTDENIGLKNNKRLSLNLFDWLSSYNRNSKKIIITTGHSEWVDESNWNAFNQYSKAAGYSIEFYNGKLTYDILKNKNILVISNAWNSFSKEEIAYINGFVNNGGSLLMMGLGWSYIEYNKNSNIESYPMNLLGESFRVNWTSSSLSDPTDNYEGYPILHTFYPSVTYIDPNSAMNYIKQITDDHSNDLDNFLEQDKNAGEKYLESLSALEVEMRDHQNNKPVQNNIYEFCKQLSNEHPIFFNKNVVFDTTKYPLIAWIREEFFRIWIDSCDTAEKRRELAKTGHLAGKYSEIWLKHRVYIADDSLLSEKQLSFIVDILDAIPSKLHDLKCISVNENLNKQDSDMHLDGVGGDVNIFSLDIGGMSENSFPPEVEEGIIDIFCSTTVHEINHLVDSLVIENNEKLKKRKEKLINAAGTASINYLRRFEDGFFTDNPQEFFASISNQWFTDSSKTIKLGLTLFDKGIKQPINQALFFAEIYSSGSNKTYFYNIDKSGTIIKKEIPIFRDTNNMITDMIIDGYKLHFELDKDGYVTDYKIIKQ